MNGQIVTAHSKSWALDMVEDILHARARISITALSMLPPNREAGTPWQRYWAALRQQAAAGIDILVILPAPTIAHPATMRNGTTASILKDAAIRVALKPATNLLHAKTMLVDGAIAWVGSGNLTAAAAHHNAEMYIRTTDHRTALQLAGFHAQLLMTSEVVL